jgi:anti-sigma-K factor RskA
MRYDDPRLLTLLAGEYVLGTLAARPRRRFERLFAAQPGLRGYVTDWEERLAGLGLALAPVTPPAHVWQRLAEQLGFAAARSRTPFWQTAGLWRALAATFAVIAVALGVERVRQAPQIRALEQQAAAARELEQQIAAANDEAARLRADLAAAQAAIAAPTYVSVMSDEAGRPLWLVKLAERTLHITVVGAPAAQPGRSYELWMLPEGGVPVSLGVLPERGEQAVALADAALAVLAGASALAVSLEPAGGSPTGQPTGPVLYSAPLLRG